MFLFHLKNKILAFQARRLLYSSCAHTESAGIMPELDIRLFALECCRVMLSVLLLAHTAMLLFVFEGGLPHGLPCLMIVGVITFYRGNKQSHTVELFGTLFMLCIITKLMGLNPISVGCAMGAGLILVFDPKARVAYGRFQNAVVTYRDGTLFPLHEVSVNASISPKDEWMHYVSQWRMFTTVSIARKTLVSSENGTMDPALFNKMLNDGIIVAKYRNKYYGHGSILVVVKEEWTISLVQNDFRDVYSGDIVPFVYNASKTNLRPETIPNEDNEPDPVTSVLHDPKVPDHYVTETIERPVNLQSVTSVTAQGIVPYYANQMSLAREKNKPNSNPFENTSGRPGDSFREKRRANDNKREKLQLHITKVTNQVNRSVNSAPTVMQQATLIGPVQETEDNVLERTEKANEESVTDDQLESVEDLEEKGEFNVEEPATPYMSPLHYHPMHLPSNQVASINIAENSGEVVTKTAQSNSAEHTAKLFQSNEVVKTENNKNPIDWAESSEDNSEKSSSTDFDYDEEELESRMLNVKNKENSTTFSSDEDETKLLLKAYNNTAAVHLSTPDGFTEVKRTKEREVQFILIKGDFNSTYHYKAKKTDLIWRPNREYAAKLAKSGGKATHNMTGVIDLFRDRALISRLLINGTHFPHALLAKLHQAGMIDIYTKLGVWRPNKFKSEPQARKGIPVYFDNCATRIIPSKVKNLINRNITPGFPHKAQYT